MSEAPSLRRPSTSGAAVGFTVLRAPTFAPEQCYQCPPPVMGPLLSRMLDVEVPLMAAFSA
jgi:hypothetical protein